MILTGILWIPYTINRCQVRGLSGAMANPSRGDKPQAEWANRLMFAHDNAVENLVLFAPLVLILNAIDYSTKWTVLACAVYFWSRVAHLIVYALGHPGVPHARLHRRLPRPGRAGAGDLQGALSELSRTRKARAGTQNAAYEAAALGPGSAAHH